MRGLLIALTALVCGGLAWFLLGHRTGDPRILHTFALGATVLSTYAWLACSAGLAAALSLPLGGVVAWALAQTHSPWIAADAAALLVLTAGAAWHASVRRVRARHLNRTIEDLTEQRALKEQTVAASAKARDALQRKHARYTRLQTIAEQLCALTDLEAIATLAVDSAFDLIGKSDVCLLFLLDRDRQQLALCASRKQPGIVSIRGKQGDQFDRYVLRTHRPLLVNDVRRDFRFTVSLDQDRPIASVIACPLLLDQSAEGVLRLDSPQSGCYTQDDLRFLDILLDLVATAVTNARLFERTQQLALTDGLTGLMLRRPFMEQLAREMSRAARNGEPLALAMADVDHFKRYNDTFGHTAGDVILKGVAEVLRTMAPTGALTARYGGEEFAVLLPRMEAGDAVRVAESIRKAVEVRFKESQGSGPGAVTLSLGVAVFPADGGTDLELIRAADQRLYRAKKGGRNAVCSSL